CLPAAGGGRGRGAGRGGPVLRVRPAQPRAHRLRQGAGQARSRLAVPVRQPPGGRAVRRRDWLSHQLPGGMVEDEFLVRFLTIFQDVADTVLHQVDTLPHMFDAAVAPDSMVRLMGHWIGIDWIDPSLPDPLQRRIVREYSALLQWRGTARGVKQLLELISGAP